MPCTTFSNFKTAVSQPRISIFASGNSLLDLTDADVELIKSRSFLITMNYAPLKYQGHANIWSDKAVTDFLQKDVYATRPKDMLWISRSQAFHQGRDCRDIHDRVDFWFDKALDGLKGNFTLVFILELLQKYMPEKEILVFGLDMKVDERKPEAYKWYDQFTKHDLNKRGMTFKAGQKLTDCAQQLKSYVRRDNVWNTNFKSAFEWFPKRDFREILV